MIWQTNAAQRSLEGVSLHATRSLLGPSRTCADLLRRRHTTGDTLRCIALRATLAWRVPCCDNAVLWRECSELGDLGGRASSREPHTHKRRVTGPMWLGPLHDTDFLRAMQRQAEARGWTGHAFEGADSVKMTGHNPPKPLEQLLDALLAESDPALPPWSVLLSDVRAACDLPRIPRRGDLIADLQRDGFSAAVTHAEVQPPFAPALAALRCGPHACTTAPVRVAECGWVRVQSRAIKTNATMAEVRRLLQQRQAVPDCWDALCP